MGTVSVVTMAGHDRRRRPWRPRPSARSWVRAHQDTVTGHIKVCTREREGRLAGAQADVPSPIADLDTALGAQEHRRTSGREPLLVATWTRRNSNSGCDVGQVWSPPSVASRHRRHQRGLDRLDVKDRAQIGYGHVLGRQHHRESRCRILRVLRRRCRAGRRGSVLVEHTDPRAGARPGSSATQRPRHPDRSGTARRASRSSGRYRPGLRSAPATLAVCTSLTSRSRSSAGHSISRRKTSPVGVPPSSASIKWSRPKTSSALSAATASLAARKPCNTWKSVSATSISGFG